MSDNTFTSFEDQLRAAARDIVQADLATAPRADASAAEAIVAASPVAPARPRRVALWPTIGAAAACLAIGYVLPHPQQGGAEPKAPTARVERVEVVRTDTIYRERIVPQTVERVVERPVAQTVEVVRTVEIVRTDTITVPAPVSPPRHAPRSLANDGFIYAFNTIEE